MSSQTFVQLLEDFLGDRGRSCRKPTIDFYTQKLTPFVQWLDAEGVTPTTISPDHWLTFVLSYEKDRPGIKTGTMRTFEVAIRTFLNWGYKKDKLPRIKVDVRPIEKDPTEVVLSPNEWEKIFDATTGKYARDKVRNVALFKLVRDCWIRRTEISKLWWGDLSWDSQRGSGLLRIRGAVSKDGKLRGGSHVWFSQDSWQAIEDYREQLDSRGLGTRDNDPVFVDRLTGEQLSPSGISQLFSRIARRSGVKNFKPHNLRHSGARTKLYGIGCEPMNPKFVQMQLRHADIGMTFNIYGQPPDSVYAEAFSQAFEGDGLNGEFPQAA